MIYNYIPVAIGEYYKVTGPSISYQYDVKQYLVLTGVELPEFFLVDFCNEGDTTTMSMTGTDNTVEIPDAYLLTGKRIKAFIVVSGTDTGASETRIEITLPVNRRPARTDITPTPAEQSTIDSLIEAMNTAVEDAGDAKTAAETAQGKAEDAQAAAEAAAAEAETAVGHYPKIENSTWWVWDTEEGAYVDTGVTAEGQPGQDGFSPIATVTQDGNVTTISITDKVGTTTADIDLGPINEDVENLALSKADIIVDTAGPAAIANFPDGADNYPIRQLVATIEPVQDLHGYDAPWPPGGEKNKLPMVLKDIKSANTSGTWSGNSYTYRGITYTVNLDSAGNVFSISATGTASGIALFYLGTMPSAITEDMEITGCPSGGGSDKYRLAYGSIAADFGNGRSIPSGSTAEQSYIRVNTGYEITGTLTFFPMIRVTTASATYEPYANFCPVNGITELNAVRTGENILPNKKVQDTSTRVRLGESSVGSGNFFKTGTYKIAVSVLNGITYGIYWRTDKNGTLGPVTNSDTITLTEDINVRIWIYASASISVSDVNWFQVTPGSSTPSEYYPYTGKSIIISWEDEAGTVYGGKLVINGDGSVDLIGDKTSVDLGALNYSRVSGQDGTYVFTTAGMSGKALGVTNIISEILATTSVTAWGSSKPDCSICGSATSTTVVIRYDACTSVNELKTALGGYKAVYGLAEPVTYHLASLTELPKVLKGVNNFWVNTGDTSVTYPADTKLYVDKKIAALAAALS